MIDKATFRALAAVKATDNSAFVAAVRQLRTQAENAEQWLGGPVEIAETDINLDASDYVLRVTFRRKSDAY